MSRPALLAGFGVVAAAGLGWWGLVGARGEAGGEGYSADLARGAAIYAEACASCHGAELEGQPDWRAPGPDGRLPAPPHDASGHSWHHSDRVLLEITMRGTAAVVGGDYESDMPGFANAHSEDELRDVLAWIKAQWPERERSYQARISAQDPDLR